MEETHMTPHAPGLGRRFAVVVAATLAAVGLSAASLAAVSTTTAAPYSKSKAPATVVDASKSKSKAPVTAPAAYARGPVVGDVVIPAAYARGPVTVVPAAYPRAPMAAPARAAATVRYASCPLTTTNGYGAVRVSLTITGTTLVTVKMTVTNHQDRAFTFDTDRIWDEFGIRYGAGGWIAPGQSKTWTAYAVDEYAGQYLVKGHATTNPRLVDSCGGHFVS
jgi:hypothetical protein